MITFKTAEFDVTLHPEKIAFLSKKLFHMDYIVCLMDGTGLRCTGTPSYDQMMRWLEGCGFHKRFKTPDGLFTCVNPDFLFLTSIELAQTTIVFPGARCVVAESLIEVEERFAE